MSTGKSGPRLAMSAWIGFVVACVTSWVFSRGPLMLRDMAVIPQPALTSAALGLGNAPPRAAPQDGLLALAGQVVDASVIVRGLVLVAAVLGAIGASLLVRETGGGYLARAAGATIALASPVVVERLLQGQWSLVICAWLLPTIAWAGATGRRGWQWGGMWLASLTPTGGIAGALVGTVTARDRSTPLLGLVLCLPWVVPGFLAEGSGTAPGAGAAAFAARAEKHAGTLGTVLGTGGIWNADAVPSSRHAGAAIAGIVLVGLLAAGAAWRAWQASPARYPSVRPARSPGLLGPLAVLAAGALVVALLGWAAPGCLSWILETVPGGGLLRDGHKFIVLSLPFLVAATGCLRSGAAALALALAVLQVPDAPVALASLRPPDLVRHADVARFATVAEEADGCDVFLPGATPLVDRGDGLPVVNPWFKAVSTVEPGYLVVDGAVVDPPNPRWVAAKEAWERGDVAAVSRLGIGIVADPGTGEILARTSPPAPEPDPSTGDAAHPCDSRGLPGGRGLGFALLAVWLAAVPASLLLGRRRAPGP